MEESVFVKNKLNNDVSTVKERIDWIDCTKGIAILLVILGHTVDLYGNIFEKILRAAIFSFHMPLFFICSGLTFKLSVNNDQFVKKIEKSFKKLILIALFIFGLRTLIDIIASFQNIEWKEYLVEKINVLVYCSGVEVQISDTIIPEFGMMWFLVVLFCARSLFDYLHLKFKEKHLTIAICICTIIGVVLGKIQWLPLSLDITFAVIAFLEMGNYFKKINIANRNFLNCLLFFVIWVVSFSASLFLTHSYMELAARRYSLFPICYITAIAGTLFIMYFSNLILKLGNIIKPLVYIGKNTIWLYCIHAMDYLYEIIWNRTNNNIANAAIRILVDIIIFVMIKIMILMIDKIKNK